MSFDQASGSVWTYLYLASEWLIRFGMLIIVPFRRSPEAAKGWLLFGFFLPWPALITCCVSESRRVLGTS